MDAAVNTINYNERFITKVAREISDKFNFNIIQQRVITDILYMEYLYIFLEKLFKFTWLFVTNGIIYKYKKNERG